MEKDNKTSKILLIVVIIISFVLGGFIVYDKVLKKEESVKCKSEVKDCDCPKCENSAMNLDYKKILGKLKNADGSYALYKSDSMSSLDDKEHVYASITVDGKVSFRVDNDSEKTGEDVLLNVSDVYDIEFFKCIPKEDLSDEKLYIITKNGDVYEYSVSNYENKNYNATKIPNLNNIVSFFSPANRRSTPCAAGNAQAAGAPAAASATATASEMTAIALFIGKSPSVRECKTPASPRRPAARAARRCSASREVGCRKDRPRRSRAESGCGRS